MVDSTTGDRLKTGKRKFQNGVFDTKEKFVELRADGRSFDEIARILKVSRQTLQSWSKLLKNDIDKMTVVRLEALKRKYALTLDQRVKSYGRMIEKIKRELEKRPLEEIPTEKLFELFLKLDRTISENGTAQVSEAEESPRLLSYERIKKPDGRT